MEKVNIGLGIKAPGQPLDSCNARVGDEDGGSLVQTRAN